MYSQIECATIIMLLLKYLLSMEKYMFEFLRPDIINCLTVIPLADGQGELRPPGLLGFS